ncbi:histidine phosphatase superfamily [Ochromonadaceae sp. CCMP2298]|nr:histidine phosphatase superfamily [Ochromonadaceae sp. CCMP2298]
MIVAKRSLLGARRLTRLAELCTSKDAKPLQLTFLRHGQSTWNKKGIFIGMTDTPLTEEGRREATGAGKMLHENGLEFDAVYTSLLVRSTDTVYLALREMGMEWLTVQKDWRLNERNYGALVGTDKKKCVFQYGKDQVKRWRR